MLGFIAFSLLFFLPIQFALLNSSKRNIKSMYRPYGPKMCQQRCNRSDYSFRYVKKHLSCQLLTDVVPSFENHSIESFTCIKRDKAITVRGRERFCEAKLKGGSLQEFTTSVMSDLGNGTKHLHQACDEGDICKVKYIIDNKLADINCRGKLGYTPVMMAAKKGHLAVFDLLIKHGCDLSAISDKNNSVFHLACCGGNMGIVSKLVLDEKCEKEVKGGIGRTPLMIAAQCGKKEVFDFLEKEGCNLKAKDTHGNNILHLACSGGRFHIVEQILSRHIFDIDSPGQQGRPPIIHAAYYGHIEVVKLLARNGCNLTAVDEDWNNILHYACFRNDVDIVKYLLTLKVFNGKEKNRKGKTPLGYAKGKNNKGVIALFNANI